MAQPILLCDCAGTDNDRWLECREHGPNGDIEYTVGGSDVATIFGISPWTTPLELRIIKKGREKPKAKPNPFQLDMEHMLESIAAHFYAVKTGNTVIDDTCMDQHADHPYALAGFDRRYLRKTDGESGILERTPLKLARPHSRMRSGGAFSVSTVSRKDGPVNHSAMHSYRIRVVGAETPPF